MENKFVILLKILGTIILILGTILGLFGAIKIILLLLNSGKKERRKKFFVEDYSKGIELKGNFIETHNSEEKENKEKKDAN